MDWRDLSIHRSRQGEEFYFAALTYAQYLWQRSLPARAILCLDRAMGADLSGWEPMLQAWPLPYASLEWILRNRPDSVFIGNPRVHFQHFADRVNQPRREQRRWRAWACWAIARKTLPHLEADRRHQVTEPTVDEIAVGLTAYGHLREAEHWTACWSARPTAAA